MSLVHAFNDGSQRLSVPILINGVRLATLFYGSYSMLIYSYYAHRRTRNQGRTSTSVLPDGWGFSDVVLSPPWGMKPKQLQAANHPHHALHPQMRLTSQSKTLLVKTTGAQLIPEQSSLLPSPPSPSITITISQTNTHFSFLRPMESPTSPNTLHQLTPPLHIVNSHGASSHPFISKSWAKPMASLWIHSTFPSAWPTRTTPSSTTGYGSSSCTCSMDALMHAWNRTSQICISFAYTRMKWTTPNSDRLECPMPSGASLPTT